MAQTLEEFVAERRITTGSQIFHDFLDQLLGFDEILKPTSTAPFSWVDKSTLNVAALTQAVEWAEAEAAKGRGGAWDQMDWATPPDNTTGDYAEPYCGTAFCVAGYVCHSQGDKFLHGGSSTLSLEGRITPTHSRAAGILGIAGDEDLVGTTALEYLFTAENSIKEVRLIADLLIELYDETGEDVVTRV